MKIAVATNDNSTVAGHVGRCRAFLIYQTDGSNIQSKEVRENSFTHHGQKNGGGEEHHGEGQGHGHQNLIEGLKDCEVLIFNHGGWRLIEDMKAHNITPILTNEEIAESAVLKHIKGELIIFEENVCRSHNN